MSEAAPADAFTRGMRSGNTAAAGARGVLLHRPRLYDLFVELALIGREPSFRRQVLDLAAPRPGEAMLDVGCGTGSLALLAREAVGATGVICGVDASAEMISWARQKARRIGVEADFRRAAAQALPYPDASFDVVLSTLMLHRLPKRARTQLAAEARRVVKPGGRVLVVDFAEESRRKGLRRHLRHRQGLVAWQEIPALLEGAGLSVVASGPLGIQTVHFALAAVRSSS